MKDNSAKEIKESFENMLNKLRSIDGQNIVEIEEVDRLRLSEDNRSAWVDHLADQYLKQEPMDDPPAEFEITNTDIINKIIKRKFKAFWEK